MIVNTDFSDLETDLKRFFNRYNEQRRLALYQALMRELVSIRAQSKAAKSVDEMNSLKHQFKGICRYLVLALDTPIDALQTSEKLFCAVDSIYIQVVAIKDEL